MPLRKTFIEIDLAALAANYNAIKHHVAPAKVMCVLKANAYGHGLVECAQHLEKISAPYFGVALLQEGIELREAGIQTPILAFAGILEDEIEYFINHDIDLTASSVSKMKAIELVAEKLGKKARVHLKVDTGLARIGTRADTINGLFEEALRSESCNIVGIYTHLAKAETEDPTFTVTQLERFQQSLRFFDDHNYPKPLRHLANSAGILRFKECHFDMVRPGVALYGVYPASRLKRPELNLSPVLSLKSKVVYFKVVPEGNGVSYSHTWTAPEDTRVVTIPVGYGDGYLRGFSNRASVLIRGKKYPIVGNICMDQFMVAINEDEAYNGDEVVLIGSQGEESITMEELATHAQTVPQEVMTTLNQRIPRIYTNQEAPMLVLSG
jgi:alanine racemase